MGFSTIGASVVVFAGLLLFTYTVTNHLFEAQRDYNRALDEDRDRAEFLRQTNITIRDGSHSSGKLHLNITNNGDTALSVDDVALFLDGTWATDDILTSTVDSLTTDIWAPAQVLYLKIDSAAQPDRARVVTETGHGATWTP